MLKKMRVSDKLTLIAVMACAAAIAVALGVQYIGGLPPCSLCIAQRWPLVGGIAFGLMALAVAREHRKLLLKLAAFCVGIGAIIAFYHVGVEQHWWLGPDGCGGPDSAGMSVDELLTQIQQTPAARCDEISFTVLGLSMAAWNIIFSVITAICLLMAAKFVDFYFIDQRNSKNF